jgi:quinol monooxygenase YgiN
MYCRVIRAKGDPAKTEQGVKAYAEQVIPAMKQQKGFAGATLVGNRETGDSLSVTYWESEQALNDSGQAQQTQSVRKATLDLFGAKDPEIHHCEVAVLERFQPPKSGVAIRVNTLNGDPAKANQGIEFFRSKVLPVLQKEKDNGCRTAYLFVDRSSGFALAGSAWDSKSQLEKSEALVTDLRRDAAQAMGSKDVKVEAMEVLFTEILQPAQAR